jgi:hypothetical protein
VSRNRKDHHIRRSFLRGFIDPARWSLEQPLWHLDIPKNVWSERSPGEGGYRHAFYDYATTEIGLETPDPAFAELEGRDHWIVAEKRKYVLPYVRAIVDGLTIEEIMEQFDVTQEQVTAVLDFAARSLEAPIRR